MYSLQGNNDKPVIDTTGTAIAPKDSLWFGLYLSPEDREKAKSDPKINRKVYDIASERGDFVGSYDDFIAVSGDNNIKYGFKENSLKKDVELKKKLENDRLEYATLRNLSEEDFDKTEEGVAIKQQLDKYSNSERELAHIGLRKSGVVEKEYENFKKFQQELKSPKNVDKGYKPVDEFRENLTLKYGDENASYIYNQLQKDYIGDIEKKKRKNDPYYDYSFQGLAENNKYIDQEFRLKPLIKKTNEDIHRPEVLEEIQKKVYDRNKEFIENYKKNESLLTPDQKNNFLEGLQSEMEAEMQNKYQQIYKENDDLISTTLIPNKVKDYLDESVRFIQNNRTTMDKHQRKNYLDNIVDQAYTKIDNPNLKFPETYVDEKDLDEKRKQFEQNRNDFKKKVQHYLLNKTTLFQNNGTFDTDVVKNTALYLSNVLGEATKQTDNKDNNIELLHLGSPDKIRGLNMSREQYKDSRNTLQYLQEVINSGDDSWSNGHWIGKGIKDPWTESNAIKAYRDASDAYGLGKKISKGEDLTFSDEIMAMAFGLKNEISSKQVVPTSYNVSSGISAMVPYIVSYIGSGALADVITKNALKHTGRQVEKEALKALALRQTKNLAKFIPRSILQSGINVQMWHPEYMRRRFELGLVDDGEGNFTPSITKERTPGEAAIQAAATTYAEIATESAGELLMHPISKTLKATGKLGKWATKGSFLEPSIAKIGKGLEKMNENMFIRGLMGKGSFTTVKGAQGGNTRIIGDFLKERMGMHGFGEEYLEEFANSRLANIFTNDVNEQTPDTKYVNPVMYWSTKNEFTTAATVGGFALLTGMGGFAVNKIFKPNITMTINNKEGKQVTVKVPSNIMSLVNDSFNKETGLFDQKTIETLRDNGKINDTQFDVLQRYSAQTEYLHEQKGLIPERTEELKKKGYTEEQIKSMNLMDKFEYEVYSNYKDLHDAEVLPKNKKGQAQMPNSEYLEKTLAEKTKAKETLLGKDIKSEQDIDNIDKLTNQEEVLGKALSEIRTKETEKEKRYFERFRLYGLTEATPIGQQPRFADFTKFITVGNNIQQRIDLLDKKEGRTKEEEAQLEQLVEDKRLIRAYLATVTTNVEKQFQDFGAKTKDSELIAAEATSKTLVATISNSIAAIPEITEEEKTGGVQDDARKEQLNDRKALEEYMSMHEQRLEIIEAEKKRRGGQDIEYDAPIDEEVIEEKPKEKVKKPRVKKKVVTPEPKVETEQTEDFGGNETALVVESDKKKSTTEKRDKAKKRIATKLAETEATIEKANTRLNNIKPEFLAKVKVSIDAISKKLDKNFEDEQKVNDPQFKTWSKTHDVVVNIWTKNPNAMVTQGQAKAIKFLSKTGIITESDYNQKLDNKMRDADTAIWLAVKRVQFLRSQTAEGSKEYNDLLELQKTVFALIQAEQNHARYTNINTSLQNLEKLDSNEIERELQRAQDKIDKNNELIKRSLTEEEVLKLRKEVQVLEDKIEVNKERLRKDKNLTSAKEQSIRLANSKMEIEIKNKQDIMKSRLRLYSEAKLKTELEEQSEYIDALNEEKAVRKEQKDINDKKKKKKESKKKEEVVVQSSEKGKEYDKEEEESNRILDLKNKKKELEVERDNKLVEIKDENVFENKKRELDNQLFDKHKKKSELDKKIVDTEKQVDDTISNLDKTSKEYNDLADQILIDEPLTNQEIEIVNNEKASGDTVEQHIKKSFRRYLKGLYNGGLTDFFKKIKDKLRKALLVISMSAIMVSHTTGNFSFSQYVELANNYSERHIKVKPDSQLQTITLKVSDNRLEDKLGVNIIPYKSGYATNQIINLEGNTFEARNRADVTPVQNAVGITTNLFKPFQEVENFKGELKRTSDNVKQNPPVIAFNKKTGNVKAGNLKDFNNDWLVSETFTIPLDFKTDINGQIKTVYHGQAERNVPVSTINGKEIPFPIGLDTKDKTIDPTKHNTFGVLEGGKVILSVGNYQVQVNGGFADIYSAWKELKSKNPNKEITAYLLDNGSYNLPILKENGVVTNEDLTKQTLRNKDGGTSLVLKQKIPQEAANYPHGYQKIETNNFRKDSTGNKVENKPTAIVLHHTGEYKGGKKDVIKEFTAPKGNSSHYLIGKDGKIYQFNDGSYVMYHAGESLFKGKEDLNSSSLGIEIQGDSQTGDFTKEQYESLIILVYQLAKKYNIPIENIVDHKTIRDNYLKANPTDKTTKNKVDLNNMVMKHIVKELQKAYPKIEQQQREQYDTTTAKSKNEVPISTLLELLGTLQGLDLAIRAYRRRKANKALEKKIETEQPDVATITKKLIDNPAKEVVLSKIEDLQNSLSIQNKALEDLRKGKSVNQNDINNFQRQINELIVKSNEILYKNNSNENVRNKIKQEYDTKIKTIDEAISIEEFKSNKEEDEKEEVSDFEALRKELFAQSIETKNKKFSKSFPNILFDNMISALGLLEKAMNSGFNSYEKIALETFSLFEEEAGKNEEFSNDHELIYDVFLDAFSGQLNPSVDENGKEIENQDVVKYRTMFKTVFDNKLKSAEKRIKKALKESLSNSGNVMTTSDQRIQEQQNNLSGLFRTIATEEGVQYDKIELEFFLEAKKGTFKNIKSEKDYLEFLVELRDSDDAFSQKLLYGIYDNNINFSWFISYRNFYENVSLVRNESIILKSGKAKNKFEISFLNPEFTIDTLVKLFTSHIEGYKINTKDTEPISNIDGAAFKMLLESFDSKGSKFQNLVNLLQHDQISMREIFENELDLLQQLTGIDREVWRDNYFFDNATKENEVYLKALTKDGKTTHIKVKFNNYNDFLDFNYNTVNDILKKVENGVTVYNGPDGLSELGFVIDNSTKSKFSNIDSIVDDKPYYKTGERFDTSISTKLVGTLKANFRKAKTRQGFNAKDFVKDYFLSDIKGEVYSNIAKLSTSHNASTKLWTSGRDLDYKRFTAFVLSNNMTTTLDEAYQNKDTDFMKELIKRGLKPELTIQRGAKGLSFGENGMQSNTEDNSNISNSDYWIFQMIYFDENPSSYNALAGQFGDKDALYYVRSPKYDFHKGQKKNQEFLNKNVKGFNALVDFFNQSFGTRVASNFGLDNEQTKEFITQFLFNFVKNADALNSIINGDFEKNYKGNFIDMVKRGAPVISPGYRLVDVEGGLNKTYSHIVIEDPKAIGIGGKEFELPNGIQICSSDFFGKFQRNMGSVYSREHQFTNLTSSKALHSATRYGVRSLTKANLMSIDVFIDTFGEESFGWLRDFMKEHNIDTISFDSGTKKNEHPVKSANASKKGSLLLFNKDLSRKEISSEEISKFVFNREKKDLYIQQDLRHDVKPKGNALPSQSKSNILSIEGSKEFIALMNKQMDVMLEGIEDEFKSLEGNNEKVKFILSLLTKQSINIDTINGEEEIYTDDQKKGLVENLTGDKKFIAQRLLSGTSPNDIFIRDAVIKKILSYVEQNGLLMFGNRQTTEAIPDIFNQLKGYEIVTYKGKKYNRLAQIAANVPNGRYPIVVDAKNIKEVVQHIEKNKAEYIDLYDENGKLNEWEIEESKDSKGKTVYTIPGELVMSSRVPGDDLHSHTLCRLTLGHADSKANTTALNQKLSEASGEDYDGDQRYNQVFFKDGQNIILDDSKEGLSNKGLLSMRKGYQNPENIEIISNPIDVEKYDGILARLAERSKEQKVFYNYKEQNNPLTWQESRNNNLVGVKMKGITTNLSTVYSYLNYIKPETKKDSVFNIPLYDSNGALSSEKITLNGISNDKFNIIKSHIGYLQNLAFDNAKDPKIEKLGFNEWTANMFIFALINDKSLSSDTYNSRDKMDEAVTYRIENIANLFNRPAFKLYTEFCRERKSVNEFESNAEVQKAAIKYITINAKEDRSDIKALKELLQASKDLATIKSVQRLTENLPKTFEEFVMNESSIDRMEGNTLSFYDMSNFIMEESGNLVPLLENSRKSTTASRKFAFDNSIETSRITQYVINEVQTQLSEDAEESYVRVDEKTLKDILSNIQTFIALVATSRGDSFNVIRDRLLKSLTELKRNSKEQNKFLDIIQMLKETKVDKETLSVSEDDKPVISVMNAYRHVEFDDSVMEDIRNDFDKLDANIKDDFFEYLLYIYGNRIASSSGSFYKFMSFNYLNEKSDIIEETMDKWSNDDYGVYSLEQIKSGVLKNLQIFKRKRFETKKQFDLSDTNNNENKLTANFEEFVRSFTLNEVNRVLTGKDISVLKQIVEAKGETINNFQQGFRRYAASRSYINKIRDVFHNIEKLLKEETISNNSTATTRVYPLGSHINENTAFAETNMVGRLFKKKETSEFYVVESVEKLTKEKINDSKWIDEWCRKESKTIEEYKNLKKDNKIRSGMYQTTFRKVDAKELTTAQNKVNNTLPKQYHGQLIYASPASGKSFFVENSGNTGLVDVDTLIMETLSELGIEYNDTDFGTVAFDNKDVVWRIVKQKIIEKKEQGYTLFAGNYYFVTDYVNAMNDGGLELVDLAIIQPESSVTENNSSKRDRKISSSQAKSISLREKKAFERKNVVTLKKNETILDYFDTSNQATLGKVNANNTFKSVEVTNESGNRIKSLSLSELAKNIKGINSTIDDIIERLVKKHGNLPVSLNLDVMNVQGDKVAKISINGIEFYRQSIGDNFEYYLQHELEHLETMFNPRLVSEIQKNLESFKKTSTNPSLYGFKNADEFLAEYFSNESFSLSLSDESRKILKNILKGNDIEDKKEVKNHIPESTNEALLTSNPKLAEMMLEHLSKVYPEVEFFSNREKFIEYTERNAKRGLQFDMRAVGHAFDAAVFIDTNRAVQSSIPHEYAHIYWDMLPDTHFAKKQLRELFSETGTDQEEIDEHIILEIGKLAVGIAEANLNVKNQSKFLALLKSFWNAIKALFSKKDYSQEALLQEISEAMWNRKPQKGDRFNQTVVHNMIQSVNPDGKPIWSSDGSIHYGSLVDSLTGNRFISPSQVKNMLDPSEFNREAAIEAFIRKIDNPFKAIIEEERENAIVELDSAAKAGEEIHNIISTFFSKGKDAAKEIVTKGEYSDGLVDDLTNLKNNILEKYDEAVFYPELTLANRKSKTAGIIDLIVETYPDSNQFIVYEFKTFAKDKFIDDELDRKKWAKSNGMFNNPLPHIKSSAQNKHKVQLFMYKNLIESQDNGSGEKNKVIMMYIVPIERDLEPITLRKENGDVVYNEDTGIAKKTFSIKKANIKNLIPLQGTAIGDIRMAEILHEFVSNINNATISYDDFKKMVNSIPAFQWAKPQIDDAFLAVNSLTSILDKDLAKISSEDVLRLSNQGIYKILRVLSDSLGFEYEDFYDQKDNHGNVTNKALPLELLVYAYQKKLKKSEVYSEDVDDNTKKWKRKTMFESVKLDRVKTGFNAGLSAFRRDQNAAWEYLDELGYDDLFKTPGKQPKLQEGDRIAEYVKWTDHTGKENHTLVYGIAEKIYYKDNHSISYVKMKTDKDEIILLNKLNKHSGVIKVVKEPKDTVEKFNLQKEFEKNGYTPSMKLSKERITGDHFDLDMEAEDSKNLGQLGKIRSIFNEIGTVENLTKIINGTTKEALVLQDEIATLDNDFRIEIDKNKKEVIEDKYDEAVKKYENITSGKEALIIYEQIRDMSSDVAGTFNDIISESLMARKIAKDVAEEHEHGIKSYPVNTEELFQMIKNPDGGLFQRVFKSNREWVSSRKIEENFPMVNLVVNQVTNAALVSIPEMNYFSERLLELSEPFDGNFAFVTKQIGERHYFKHYTEINSFTKPDEYNFAKFIYDTYNRYELIVHDKENLIPVPSDFMHISELSDHLGKKTMWGGAIFNPIRNRIVHSALRPMAYDNEKVNFDGELTSLLDIKKYYAGQLSGRDSLESIFGTKWEYFKNKFRSSSLTSGKLSQYVQEAKTQYNNKNKNNTSYRLNSHTGKDVAINSKLQFKFLEKHGRQLIHNFHFGQIVPTADYVLNKYLKVEMNVTGSTTKYTFDYLKDYTNMLIYNKPPEGTNEITKKIVTSVIRLVSLKALSFNLKSQVGNFIVGVGNNLIHNFNSTILGAYRIKNMRKILHIMNNAGVVTIVSDAELDKLDGFLKKAFDVGYLPMEWTEKSIQGLLFAGLMTKEQIDAYDVDGHVVDSSKALSTMQSRLIRDRISKIQGDYNPIYAAPVFGKVKGAIFLNFRKWMLNAIENNFRTHSVNRNHMQDSSKFKSLMLLWYKNKHNFFRTKQERKEEVERVVKAFKNKQEEENKQGRYVKISTYKTTEEYVNLLTYLAKENLNEKGENDYKITLTQDDIDNQRRALAVLVMGIGIILAMNAGGDDKKYKNIFENKYLSLFLNSMADLTFMVNPWRFSGNNRSPLDLGTLIPTIGFIADVVSFGQSIVYEIESIGNKYVPEAYYDNNFHAHSYARQGWKKLPFDLIGLLPAGVSVKQIFSLILDEIDEEERKKYDESILFWQWVELRKNQGTFRLPNEILEAMGRGESAGEAARIKAGSQLYRQYKLEIEKGYLKMIEEEGEYNRKKKYIKNKKP